MKTHQIVSFHPGRQHNLEQAYQISKTFIDYKHLTSLYFDKQKVNRLRRVHPKLAASLSKRSADISAGAVDVYPIAELTLLAQRKFRKLSALDFLRRNERFQNWIVRNYFPSQICIGYDTSSWVVFEKWKGKSFLILDLSIAAPQYKLALAKQTGINSILLADLIKDDSLTYDIYAKELELADLILCGSNFVKDSCISQGIDPKKLVILPYGADLVKFHNPEIQRSRGPIKIVFIGSVCFRKGANIAFEAWERVCKNHPGTELHFYGGIQMDVPTNLERIFFHGFISQDELVNELKSAHISILPTFFEGSSLAIYQSMAVGLAVITTPNAGSIIENQRNGLLISYGSANELATSLEILLNNESLRKTLAQNAQRDIQVFTWDSYGKKLNAVLNDVLKGL